MAEKISVDIQHKIKDLESGKAVSFESYLDESKGGHGHRPLNRELEKYLKDQNAVFLSATQVSSLLETGYVSMEKEIEALNNLIKTLKVGTKEYEDTAKKIDDVTQKLNNSRAKGPSGDTIHKLLEMSDKYGVDLEDPNAYKRIEELAKKNQEDAEKLAVLRYKNEEIRQYNLKKAIATANIIKKERTSAGMVGGETEKSRSIMKKIGGQVYVVSGSTDWTDEKAGKIGDYKTTRIINPKHNLVQSNVNSVLLKASGVIKENAPIQSQVISLPLDKTGRVVGTQGVYNVNVGSYEENMKMIEQAIEVYNKQRTPESVRIPGSFQSRLLPVDLGGGKSTWQLNGIQISDLGKNVEKGWLTPKEIENMVNMLPSDEREHFVRMLYSKANYKQGEKKESDSYYRRGAGFDKIREAIKNPYQNTGEGGSTYVTYAGKSLTKWASEFKKASDEYKKEIIDNIVKDVKTTGKDYHDLAAKLFYGQKYKDEEYYSTEFVNALRDTGLFTRSGSDYYKFIETEDMNATLHNANAIRKVGTPFEVSEKPSFFHEYLRTTPDEFQLEEERNKSLIADERNPLSIYEHGDEKLDEKSLAWRVTRIVDFAKRLDAAFEKIAKETDYNIEDVRGSFLANNPYAAFRYKRSQELASTYDANITKEGIKQWIDNNLNENFPEEENIITSFAELYKNKDLETMITDSKGRQRKISVLDNFLKTLGYGLKTSGEKNAQFGLKTISGIIDDEYELGTLANEKVEFERQIEDSSSKMGDYLLGKVGDKISKEIDVEPKDVEVTNEDSLRVLSELLKEKGLSTRQEKLLISDLKEYSKKTGYDPETIFRSFDLDKKGNFISRLKELSTESKVGAWSFGKKTQAFIADNELKTEYENRLEDLEHPAIEDLAKEKVDEIINYNSKFTNEELLEAAENIRKSEKKISDEDGFLPLDEMVPPSDESSVLHDAIVEGKKKLTIGIDETIAETKKDVGATKEIVESKSNAADALEAVVSEVAQQIPSSTNAKKVRGAKRGKTPSASQSNDNGPLPVFTTSIDKADLSKAKATTITTDYLGNTIGKTYKYMAEKIFADYGSGGLQAWMEKAKEQGLEKSGDELIGILTKVPSYKKSSGGLSKAGRNAFDEIMSDTFGQTYQPKQGLGAVLNETKGVHEDTTAIRKMLGNGELVSVAASKDLTGGGGFLPPENDDGSIGGASMVADKASKKTSKKSDRVKAYLDLEKQQSSLRLKIGKETDEDVVDKYQKLIEDIQISKDKLGEFSKEEQDIINAEKAKLELNESFKLQQILINNAKRAETKETKDLAAQESTNAKDYQNYLNQRLAILTKIEQAQAQANITVGREKIAAEGVVEQRNIELQYLDKKNEALSQIMASTQKAAKEDMDYNQALKVSSMRQEVLLSKKGATSLWTMMANDIKRATMRVTDFGIAAKMLNSIPQSIKQIVQVTKELDAAMTNIRIVGGYNEEQAKSLMKSYTELGRTLGATTTEIAIGMNDWLRQGYEAEDQLEALVSASTKLSKLGMISASEATTALTSALKAFNLAADDAIKVVDKLTKVDQLAAVSAGGIATALQKSSTSAKLAGMSMDELIGSVSVIGEVTQQSMDTVGNAMKSILARYGNVKASVFTQMGLNDDGETTDNINDIEKVLSKLGIKVRSSSLEMRDITSVLDDVNVKWSTFDTVTKNAIATAFGGTRMRENFLVLMENWSRVKELTDEATKSAGTADEKYEAYMDSMEAYTKRIQNAWEEISQSFEGSALIKTGAKVLTFFVENLQTLTPLIITLAATKFSDPIWGFLENTAKGAPSVFKKLFGIGTNKAKAVTYDEDGNPIVGTAIKGKDGLLLKANQQITSAVNTQGQKTNSTLTQILSTIKMLTNRNIRFDSNGKIINELTLNGGKTTVEYRKDKKTGQYGYFYTGNNHRVTKSSDIQKLEAQRQAIDNYNSQLGTAAKTGQISSYSNVGWWSGKARKMTVDGMEYTLGRDGTWINQAGEAMSSEQQAQANLINAQLGGAKTSQRVKAGATAGIAAALGALSISKTVGAQSGGLGGLLSKGILGDSNTQSVEETGTDKAIRVGLSGGLAAVGSVFGPIGAMIGQTIGEAGSSIVSTLIHRSELEMKQRVADAKENLSVLNAIEENTSNNSDVLGKDEYDSDDYKKLQTYVDNLRKSLVDNPDLAKALLMDINDSFGSAYSSMEKVYSQILKGNTEINKALQRQLELTTARLKIQETINSQEDDRDTIDKLERKEFSGANVANTIFRNLYSGLADENLLDATYEKFGPAIDAPSFVSTFSIAGKDIYEQAENAKKALDQVRLAVDGLSGRAKKFGDNLVAQWESIADDYQKQADKLTELNKEVLKTQVNYAYLSTDVLNTLTSDEIYKIGFEGVVDIIAAKLKEMGLDITDEKGNLHEDVYNVISTAIKSDADLLEKITRSSKNIGKLISDDDIKGIKAFARAFGMTVEEAKKLGEQFDYLTQAMGMMNVEETTEYYAKLSDVFSKLASNANLTASEINTILTTSELKDLIPYLTGEGGSDAVLKELFKRLYGGGQDIHTKNALYDAAMGASTDSFVEYLKTQDGGADFVNLINEKGYKTLLSIREDYGELNEEQKKLYLDFLDNINYTYKKDLTAVETSNAYLKTQLEDQINNLQEQKDALSQINDERKKELELIKAKEALENAKKERKRVYRAGVGFVYEADEEAIATAQENLENLNTEKVQENLQLQIDMLQQQKDILETLPNKEQLEQQKKIYDLWAAGAETKGSLASVAAKVIALGEAYDTATGKFNLGEETKDYLNTPKEDEKRETSEEHTDPLAKVGNNSDTLVFYVENIAKLLAKRWGMKIPENPNGTGDAGGKKNASGTTSFGGGKTLINELGTEAVITPGGTLTALPSKTGIVPADITRNVWALGEIAPTLVARLNSLTQKMPAGNYGNTTYEEGQYFDNFTMNVYPTKDYDMDKLLMEARAKIKLTKHNN